MNLLDEALDEFRPVLESERKAAQDREVTRKAAVAATRAEALELGRRTLDRVLGRHDGLEFYSLDSESPEPTYLRSIKAVIYRLADVTLPALPLQSTDEHLYLAVVPYNSYRSEWAIYARRRMRGVVPGPGGFLTVRRITSMADLGRVLHENGVKQGDGR